MKIELSCNSVQRKEIIDLEKDWNISEEEWKSMDDKEKDEFVMEWASNYIDIGYEEIGE
jgi:hypothetical protein